MCGSPLTVATGEGSTHGLELDTDPVTLRNGSATTVHSCALYGRAALS